MTEADDRTRGASSVSAPAASALAVGLGFAALVVGLSPAPSHWTRAERALSATAGLKTPLVQIWHGWARSMGAVELAVRLDVLAGLLVILNASVAILAARALFRGSGRWLAAAAAGPLCALGLVRWTLAVGAADAVPGLVVSALATAALWSVVHARVHVGGVTPVATARALAAVSAIALVSLRAAGPLALLVVAMAAATAARRSRAHLADGDAPSASQSALAPRRWSRWVVVAAIGVAPALAAMVVLFVLRGPSPGTDPTTLHLAWPRSDALAGAAADGLVYPAAALLLLLIFVLRWRGGPWLAAWALLPVVVFDGDGPLIPHAVVAVVIGVATAGWVWLAGQVARGRHPWAGMASLTAAVGLLGFGYTFGPSSVPAAVPEPVGAARPTGSLVSLYARGMLAPGDIVVVHDRWLLEALYDRRGVSGWRPDVALLDGHTIGSAEIEALSLDWRGTGRRVVSDSHTLGGRWDASWAIDSGPLFWFIGDHDPSDRDFTDLAPLSPELGERGIEQMRRWTRLAVERSRYRRAVAEPQPALAALPLDERRYRGLVTRLQLAQSASSDAAAGSELPAQIPGTTGTPAPDDAIVMAEAGDLLFAHGEQQRASELLIAAANDGYAPAWGALARWQLRSGATGAAKATMAAIAGAPALRGQALAVLHWLLARQRVSDAREFVSILGAAPAEIGPHNAAVEAAARLRLLDAMAGSTSPDVTAPAPAVGQR